MGQQTSKEKGGGKSPLPGLLGNSTTAWSDESLPCTETLDLTIFVACYNEAENIRGTLDDVVAAMKELGCSYEVFVIDDASRDRSVAVVRQYLQEHPDLPIFLHVNSVNQGLARNFVTGASLGRGKYYKLVCGDNVEPKASLIQLFRHLGTAELLLPYHEECPGKSQLRVTLSHLFTRLVNLVGGHSIRYYNGCAVYRRADVLRCPPSTGGLGFQAEMVTRLLDEGVSYRQVLTPVRERQAGSSSALSLRNVRSAAHCLFSIGCRRLRRTLSRRRASA
jgi:glycosyltransferase involved in cell wall biosynthesis